MDGWNLRDIVKYLKVRFGNVDEDHALIKRDLQLIKELLEKILDKKSDV